MAIVDYAYSNTRIRAMRSLFLKNNDVEALIRAKDLRDYLSYLQQTPYGGIFSGVDEATINGIEGILNTDLIKTTDKIINISPKNCVPFLDALSKKYQFERIGLILNSKMENLSPDEIMSKFFTHEKTMEEFLAKLISLPVDDIPALLCERYKGLDELIPASSQPRDVVIALDRYYFSGLWDSVDHLRGVDKKIASRFVSMEIDTRNIMMTLRSITHGYDIKRFIISGYDSYLTKRDTNALDGYGRDNVAELIERFSQTIYGPALENVMPLYQRTNSLMHFELALKEFLTKESRRVMEKYQFQIGFIIGFLKLKGIEIENLKAICVGVGENLPADEIRDLLISS